MTRYLALALVPLLQAMTAGTQAAPLIEEVLTPAQYFECQIAARLATLEGLEARLALNQRGNATEAEKRSAGEDSRNRVTLAMYACGKQNAGTLGAYAHRNADELQTWLNANPQVQARLESVRQRIASVASQMPAVSPSAKR